ncbi:MAG: hypothetical protein N2652_04140 [Kiritimatiellae bacterium]|nr:hypothetical protein [Kiritimatiellia bacterium]
MSVLPSSAAGDRAARTVDLALVLAFAVFLLAGWLPAQLGWAPDPARAALRENRSLHPWPRRFPRGAWTHWSREFELAVQDRLAWRTSLIAAHHRMMLALGVSPRPEVIVGSGGTLFYDELRRRGYRPVRGYGATFAYPEPQLRLIARVLETRRRWLERRGIDYLVVLIPDKQSVYPERLPRELARAAQPSSAAAQVVDALRRWTGVDALDLTPALRAARGLGELYYRYDTHWTPLGVAVGAAAIGEHLRTRWPQLPRVPLRWRQGQPVRPPYLDLARLLGLEAWYHETAPAVHIEDWPAARLVRAGTGTDPIEFVTEHTNRPSAWVLHDSFTGLLAHHLAPLFHRSLFQWHTRAAFCAADILAWRPTLVIEIFVERHANLWRGNEPEIAAEEERAAFERSNRVLAFAESPPVHGEDGTEVAPTNGSWQVCAGPHGAVVRLAGLHLAPEADAIMRFGFDSTSPLRLELSWRRAGRPVRLHARLAPGRVEWWVRLSAPDDDGPYRLRVAGAETFVLLAPEARAVPRWEHTAGGVPPADVP